MFSLLSFAHGKVAEHLRRDMAECAEWVMKQSGRGGMMLWDEWQQRGDACTRAALGGNELVAPKEEGKGKNNGSRTT